MSSVPEKVVLDTSVLISAAIYPQSPAAQAVMAALLMGRVYRSEDTFEELRSVLTRPKFDRYFIEKVFTRFDFLASFEQASEIAEVNQVCTDCADPKDNMFLSLAVSVGADCIVSGDKAHLISMHPYRGIEILSVGDFLRRVQRQ
ncbi:putative toxin-antitoxin system toxin component, PIN family [Hydrogenophaga sp. A37]|uniref:putative toxin-antitoxin system toxin component, PIN family n=1 Tax=Hydrogenophaga sp. A37 TaxID=1945864 RepID=UPI0009878D9F|nr:putative toxin-antitoxin system toxin component, PIN family [Hydrogenophaga sp. A37]OOG83800.1 putative toxin-antitoxin system toxin component, PIN family [Hydrogenophaga sp. A37]